MMVMSGSFKISNGTDSMFDLKVGQMLKVPRGSEISYQSNEASSFMYIVDQPPVLERATEIQKAISGNPTSTGVILLSLFCSLF